MLALTSDAHKTDSAAACRKVKPVCQPPMHWRCHSMPNTIPMCLVCHQPGGCLPITNSMAHAVYPNSACFADNRQSAQSYTQGTGNTIISLSTSSSIVLTGSTAVTPAVNCRKVRPNKATTEWTNSAQHQHYMATSTIMANTMQLTLPSPMACNHQPCRNCRATICYQHGVCTLSIISHQVFAQCTTALWQQARDSMAGQSYRWPVTARA
jgi:hypothetical protein